MLAEIDYADGKTLRERIRQIGARTFVDEHGQPWRFAWRTIENWWGRYRKHGRTVPEPRARSDKGRTRKVELEALTHAIEQVLPGFRSPSPAKARLYQACLERGLLRPEQISPTTFNRLVNHHHLLQPHSEAAAKCRLAFSKQFANQMWQVDTLHGPFVHDGKAARPTRLIFHPWRPSSCARGATSAWAA